MPPAGRPDGAGLRRAGCFTGETPVRSPKQGPPGLARCNPPDPVAARSAPSLHRGPRMSEHDHKRVPGRARAAATHGHAPAPSAGTPGKGTLVKDVRHPRKQEVQQFFQQLERYLILGDFEALDIGDPALEGMAWSARRVASMIQHKQTAAIREWAALKPKLLATVSAAKKLGVAQTSIEGAEGAIETTQSRITDLVAKQAEESVAARSSGRRADLDGGSGLDSKVALAELKQGMSAARKAYQRAKTVVAAAQKGVAPARAKAEQIRNRHAVEVGSDHTLQLEKQSQVVGFPNHPIDPKVKALHDTPGGIVDPGPSSRPGSARALDTAANVTEGIGKLFEVFDIIEAPSKIEEKLSDFQEKGLLGQAATVLDVLSIGHKAVSKSMILVLEIVQPFVGTAAANQIAQHISFLKGVGTAFSAVEVVAGALHFFDAVERGDERGAIDAAADAATGAVGLVTATGAGAAAVGGMALGTILMWREGLKAFGEMGGTLREMKDRAAKTAVTELIAAAHEVGEAGAALAAAEDELHMQPGNPKHADHRLQEKYEATLEAMVQQRRAVFEQRYLHMMDKHIGYNDPERLGGHPDLVKELGAIPRDADAMVARWPEFARGIKRMARYAVAFKGGTPHEQNAYYLTAAGVADKDNPFLAK